MHIRASKNPLNILKLDENLDKRVTFVAIGASAILLIVNFATRNSLLNYEVCLTVLSASAVYLLLRKKTASVVAHLVPSETRPRMKTKLYILNILFFTLLATSFIILQQNPYSRSLAFLAIASLMAGILALEIATYRSERYAGFILLKILILGLLLRASVYYQFPGTLGADPWYHTNFIKQLLVQGKIGEFGAYKGFPGMHIFVSSISLVTGLGLRHSYFFVGIVECLSLIFIFLIGKIISNEKLGLFAALLLGIVSQHILWGYYIIAMSFCLALMPMIVFLLFSRWRGISWGVILLLTCFTVVISHSISAAVLLCILAGTWIALLVFKLGASRGLKPVAVEVSSDASIATREDCPSADADKQKKQLFSKIPGTKSMRNSGLLWLIAIYSAIMVGYWRYVSGSFDRILNNIYIAAAPGAITPPVTPALPTPLVPPAWANLAVLCFMFFAIVGSLYVFRQRRKKAKLGIPFIILSLLMPALVLLLFNAFRGSLPHRWIPFVLVLASIPASIGFFLLCSAISKRRIAAALFMSMTILSMFMVTNRYANVATVIPQDPLPRIAFTASEIKATETLSRAYSEHNALYVDAYYYNVFKYHASLDQAEDVSAILTEGEKPADGGIVVLRDEIKDNPFYTTHGISKKLGSQLYQSFMEGEDYVLLYNCGAVKAIKYQPLGG